MNFDVIFIGILFYLSGYFHGKSTQNIKHEKDLKKLLGKARGEMGDE